jgi:hypothetical protein
MMVHTIEAVSANFAYIGSLLHFRSTCNGYGPKTSLSIGSCRTKDRLELSNLKHDKWHPSVTAFLFEIMAMICPAAHSCRGKNEGWSDTSPESSEGHEGGSQRSIYPRRDATGHPHFLTI